MRQMCKIVMSNPIAAAGCIVDKCRQFDNASDTFVAFVSPLPVGVKEVILAEALRGCLLRASAPDDLGNEASKHNNVCLFIGKLLAAYDAVDPYVAFLYVVQSLREQVHASDVEVIEHIFQQSLGASSSCNEGG